MASASVPRRGSTGRLERSDWILLGALLPLFAVCLGLHVREAARSGVAQLPVWAIADPAGGHPRVGFYRVETDSSGSGLLPGDRLLRVGERDLRGVGYIGFDAIALEAARDGPTPLVFERDGVRGEVLLWPRPRPYVWARLPCFLLAVTFAVLVLLRAPNRADARRFFAAVMTFAIVQSQFYGGPAWQTWASLLIWNLGTPVSIVLVLRWASLFPAEVGEHQRAAGVWPWVGLAFWAVHRISYFQGGPIPPAWVPVAGQGLNGAFMAGVVALLFRNYALAEAVGRRRLRWVLAGAAVGVLPLVASQLLLVFRPEWSGFEVAYALAVPALFVSMASVVVATVRYNLFDVDRLLSATATYTILLTTLVASTLLLLPALAGRLAEALLIPASWARAVLVLSFAASLIPLQRRLAPRIDALFFPERLEREQGIDQLVRDLSECGTTDDVVELTAERLHGLLRPEFVSVHQLASSRFESRLTRGAPDAPAFPARGPLALALERDPRPLEGSAEAVPDAGPAEREALASAAVLLPLRCGKDLVAVVSLGPRRSGDVYTPTDVALLGVVAEKASAELRRLRDAETIRYERIRADELAQLKAAADRAHRDRSRFLAAASHDLRQPLHALGLYAGLLREQLGTPGAEPLVGRIEHASASLAEMFSSLLDVSRLDVGAVEPRVEALDVDALLAGLAAELDGAATRKGLALRIAKSGLAVRSDPVLLARILRNLAHNAVAYTRAGSVELASRAAGDRVEIAVRDTGPGIEPERQDEIFREFVRLDDDPERRGLGLGLSIAERLARLLGHGLALDSEPGRGSTFRLLVPRAEAAAREPGGSGVATPLAGRRVVVIDDDVAVLEATRETLRSWGCLPILARSAEDALRGLERHDAPPDVILADYALEDGATGLEAIAALREAHGELPAAILTAETAAVVVERIQAAGVPRLAKPVVPARLRALLAELVRRGGPDRSAP